MPRLHKSSWVVATLTLAVLVLIVVPGQVENWYASRMRYSHGWPTEFLRRDLEELPPWEWKTIKQPPQGPPWLYLDGWNFVHASKTEWNRLNLLLDLGVAIGCIGLLTAAWEFRRRRRANLLQLRLSDFFLATAIVAFSLTWITSHWHGHFERAVADVMAGGSDGSIEYENGFFAPRWFTRLAGLGNVPRCFYRMIKCQFTIDADNIEQIEQLLPRLTQFKYLRRVEIYCDSEPLALRLRDALRAEIPNCEIVLPDFQNQNEPQTSGNGAGDDPFE